MVFPPSRWWLLETGRTPGLPSLRGRYPGIRPFRLPRRFSDLVEKWGSKSVEELGVVSWFFLELVPKMGVPKIAWDMVNIWLIHGEYIVNIW